MDAGPILRRIAAALFECRLESVLIGNAAAALQGGTGHKRAAGRPRDLAALPVLETPRAGTKSSKQQRR